MRPGVVERQHRLWPVLGDGLLRALGDQLQRRIPADRLEFVAARRTGAAQGLAQAQRAVHEFGVVLRHLFADRPRGVGIDPRPAYLADPTGLDADLQRTGIGAIERANRSFDRGAVIRHGRLLAGWVCAPTSARTATFAPGHWHQNWRHRANAREYHEARAIRRRESSTTRYRGFYP